MPSQNLNSFYKTNYSVKLDYSHNFDLTLAQDEREYDEEVVFSSNPKTATIDTLYKGIGIGFCGGFTTFSAFSLESYSLWKNHHIVEAFLYTSSSFIVGLAAITAGILLGGLLRK